MNFIAKSVGFLDRILEALWKFNWSGPSRIIQLFEFFKLD